MNKNLSIVSQNNKLMLKKSKSLMNITNNILSNDNWMQRLWRWADEKDISDLEWTVEDDYKYSYGMPRNKTELLNLIDLDLSENHLTELVKEIENLINLTGLWLQTNQLTHVEKEITNLKNLTYLWLSENHLSELPKEIGNLSSLTHLKLAKNKLKEVPKEIGNLLNLKELYLYENELVEFPKVIVNLTNLVKFDFEDNPNLVLTAEQKEWIHELIKNGCDVIMDDKYQHIYGDVEIERRYKYLDQFNIGREVPITPEMLDNDIPPMITDKLADGTVTFEEFLDEVSEYLDKEKFNNLVIKIYDRNYDLGECFKRNITFNTYEDNKLTWKSTAEGEDKKMLITHWGLINMFVKDTFGFETKIVNIPASKN